MIYELKEYSFGETIGKGFNLYFNNFIQIFLISLLCRAPLILVMRYFNWLNPDQLAKSFNFARFGVVMPTSLITQSILSAWIIYLVSKKFLEDSSIFSDQKAISFLPKLFPIIGLSIVVGLLTILGALALIIPGIIIALGYSVATNVLVIEGKTIGKSMKRSWELTKGDKGRIFGLLFVTCIIVICIRTPLSFVLRFLLKDKELLTYLSMILSALTGPIQSCILVVIYFNLRIKKEGFNIEHLAEQFSLANHYSSSVEG